MRCTCTNCLCLWGCKPNKRLLHPTEHIWDYIREQKEFNNYTFETLDHVDKQLGIALCDLHNEKEIIKSMCNFDWIYSAIC